jgi:D-threo-aldose 1-dehydrogenase
MLGDRHYRTRFTTEVAEDASPSPKQPVARTLLPRCGLEVSRIGLGLAHLHLLSDDAARKRLLHRAIDLGITHFDTARFYSDGFSEATAGRLLAQNRSSITIATKFGLLPTPLIGSLGAAAPPFRKARSLLSKLRMIEYPRRSYTRATMRESLQASLRALKTDHIDIYLLHEPLLTSRLEEGLFEDLEKEKQKGSIRYIGVSGASVDSIVEHYGHFLDVVQTSEASWSENRFVPDITHSLFSNAVRQKGAKLEDDAVQRLMHDALARRPSGAVVVQTRQPEHLEELVTMAEGR